jgi:hypothetical protein
MIQEAIAYLGIEGSYSHQASQDVRPGYRYLPARPPMILSATNSEPPWLPCQPR